MNNYLKIKKKYFLIFIITFFFVCSVGGYYFWCAYHPKISILIGDSPSGKEFIKMEAPKIAITGNSIAKPAAYVELKVNNIIMQHEFMNQYIATSYKTADIKLDIQVKDKQTILKYYGTVTNLSDETEEFEKVINCDFVLDAKIERE